MVRLGDSRDVLPKFPNTLFAANRATAQSQRTQTVGFLRAWVASLRWMRANTAEAQQLVETELKVNPKIAASMIEEMTRTGAIDPASLELALQLRNQFGLTPKMGPDINRYYDAQYYDAAAGR
jgi:ABC-type nitrate/sulfonate/bicarbonate transport system substrate-binding protein